MDKSNDTNVIEVTTTDEWNAVVSEFPVVIVDCFALWCMPCKMMTPVFKDLASANASRSVAFVKVDIEKAHESIVKLLDVTALPSFRVIYKQQVVKNSDFTLTGGDRKVLSEIVSRAKALPM